MRTTLLLFMLCAALLPAVLVQAQPAHDFKEILWALSPATTVPPEWDGIWVTTDTVFNCTGGVTAVSTSSDTLCGGKTIPSPGGINYVCVGTADATTMHVTCTYDYSPIPDCQAHSVIVINGTMTGNTFSDVDSSRTTFSGTGFGCNLLPPVCSVTHIHGTRTGPAPAAYCATATLPATWGKIKEMYR